jgi:hypothetical protein
VRDKNQFLYLARQAYPENPESLYRAYLEATDRPHSYFILDFAQDTSSLVRFRAGVFPDEQTTGNAKDRDKRCHVCTMVLGARVHTPVVISSEQQLRAIKATLSVGRMYVSSWNHKMLIQFTDLCGKYFLVMHTK